MSELRLIPDAVVASLLNPEIVRTEILATLHSQAAGRAGLSEPRSLFLSPLESGTHYHIKGGYLTDAGVAGIRLGGIPGSGVAGRGMRLLVLSDLATAAPLAVVAETTLYTLRVGGALALCIELLRAPSARTLALIGTGRLARAAVLALQATCPFPVIRVTSRSAEHRERFCHELAAQGIAGLQPATSLEAACSRADVILTITTANEPLVRAAWCGPGSLLVTAGGGQECEDAAILGADRIVVDDWAQCTLLGDLAVLHRQGKLTESRIAGTLAAIVAGCIPGREWEGQRLVAVPQGLTILDVALGAYIYRIALQRGLGTTVKGL